MPNSKQIVYLSQAQYQELITNGTITVDGVTVTYDENDIYVTPQAEPVTDVKVNNVSVTVNGVANVPVASDSVFGVVKPHSNAFSYYQGSLITKAAGLSDIKESANTWKTITPAYVPSTAFYGLAKASGDTTQSQSSNEVGTYTPAAKAAIQSMLGVSDLIATAEPTLVASKAYAIGDVFTANGKLYKATAAIAANDTIVLQNEGETISGANAVETKIGEGFPHDVQVNGVSVVSNGVANVPAASTAALGVCKFVTAGGIVSQSGNPGSLIIDKATDYSIKMSTGNYQPIVPSNQHASAFYGLAKAAGDTTQSASDNAVGTYTDDAKAAIRTMLGAVGDVQVNGTSVVNNGIANIPMADSNTAGVTKVGGYGIYVYSGHLRPETPTVAESKAGTTSTKIITPQDQHKAVFYGLAKAAGDTTMSSSSNAVGTYTDSAKASIKQMLGIVDGSTGTVDVNGAAPSITAVENTRYVCGEVTSLSFTPAANGICIVRFTSGSTATLLTVPNTVKFPEWFDSTSLETNTIYEICVTDGVYGAVMLWAQ